MIRRSRFEVAIDIIRECRLNSRKSRIQRSTNVAGNALSDYLTMLVEAGYVTVNDSNFYVSVNNRAIGRIYSLTEKGLSFIYNYDKITEELRTLVGKEIEKAVVY